jgi:hypothetical protein
MKIRLLAPRTYGIGLYHADLRSALIARYAGLTGRAMAYDRIKAVRGKRHAWQNPLGNHSDRFHATLRMMNV